MIKELEQNFSKSGVDYRQLLKNETFVLYECRTSNDKYYELFRPRTSKPHPLSKETYEAVEVYPSTNSFGFWAWCCNGLESINKILHKHFSEELTLTKEDLE